MSSAQRWILSSLLLLSSIAQAFSPRIDIKGIVKSLDETTVVIETHGQDIEVPRAAFEDQEALEIGINAKARLELKDLSKVKSAKK